MENTRNQCHVCRLGLITFPKAMHYEHTMLQLRYNERLGDTLLIFEHPPTITLGKLGNANNVLLPAEELERRGIAYYASDRGGDATFNCPGQLVIHPIINVRQIGPRNYLAGMQNMAMRVVRSYGIRAELSPKHPGVWVAGKQIAAIGLRMRLNISMHGLSLNVNPDLSTFNVINLCGIEECKATSIETELGSLVFTTEVLSKIEQAFAEVFNFKLVPITQDQLDTMCFEAQSN